MTVEERKAWERLQRQNRIVDIAQDIFFEKGFEQTTIIEIAKAAGYSKRSIYLYFKDREEVFLAVVLRGLSILHDAIESACRKVEENSGGLGVIGRAFYDFSIGNPGFLKLIMLYESRNCIYYETGKTEVAAGTFAAECQRKTDATAAVITRAIQRGIDRGTIKTRLTPIQLMLVLWGHVLGMMQIISIRKEHFEDAYGIDYRELFAVSQEIVEKGIAGA